jgi:tetratricopeptide (TPR) repeat protein
MHLSTGAADPVYFLLHVPRTAGQTIELHLEEHAAPGTVWMPRHLPGRPMLIKPRRHDLSRLGNPRSVRAVVGHDIGCSLERYFEGREIRRVVLLRDPIGHQLSLYNYRMMNHLNKGLGTYSFGLHVRAQPRDWVAHRLLHIWLEMSWARLVIMSDSEKYRTLNEMLCEFWFVGSYADCDRVIAAIAPDLDVPPQAPARNTARQWRRQIYWEPLTAEDLGPAKRAALLKRTPIDTALWENWQSAGFDTRSVVPRRLKSTHRDAFAAHEVARPAFLAARKVRRDWAARLPLGRSGNRLKSGFIEADLALRFGRWRVAADYYRRGLSEEPRAPAIWVQYGHALKLCGELEEAEQAYREALHLDPEDADTHVQLGNVLYLQNRAAEAADAYRRALSLDAELAEATAGLHALGAAEATTPTAFMVGGSRDSSKWPTSDRG